MAANVTNPIYLSSYADEAFTFIANGGPVEQYTVVDIAGQPVADGVAGTLVGGIAGSVAEDGEPFNLIKDNIAVVKVEASEAITFNAPIAAADTGTGRVRVGVPGTDQIIGLAMDTSDGSGTALAPHYIRVYLAI